ncbi:MAG: hypothetical protein EXS05_21290 [Planctomycetaceae bacterium]|nr:hypothetical protein [Planctomycetaceae bacterium]
MIADTQEQFQTSGPATNAPDWLDFSPNSDEPDELFEPTGEPRPHARHFFSLLKTLGLSEVNRRWADARQLIHENGVTYNVYGDPRGMNRPWQFDPIPQLISAADAALLEQGLIQRGRLLEAVMHDLYGPQTCLREGLLPRNLIYPNPSFLRSCHNIEVPLNRYLHLYAANIGRGADGLFRVLGDRTQSPSGAGYALENRIVLSRMLPDAFRECRVQRLATFFRTLRDTLRAIAPHDRDNPRIVLLTPGPYNETYFEHAYLARYLRCTLVEGNDLTVRDNRVYLKVLGALQPVDVIFRRLDDDYCDPLELRHDSFLGVPGLVQVVRMGNVAVANALGTGVLETPGLLSFLPELCRHFLSEDLRLPSVATWWCGDPVARDYVLAHLDEMVIKPALDSPRFEPVFTDEMSRAQRDELLERIRARPGDYVGQERLTLSTTPVLDGDRLQPRHQVLRTYLTAHGDSFVMMPGGLTRVSASADTMVVSMQRGGGSKDTWVLSDAPVGDVSLLPPRGQPVELNRGGNDLPSRVADNLYWLGRYVERAEGLTRLLRAVFVRLTETSGIEEAHELPVLLAAVTAVSRCYPGFIGDGADARLAQPERELQGVIHDLEQPGSLASNLEALYRLAGVVRDRISRDMWRVISDLVELRRATAPDVLANGLAPGAPRGSERTLSSELDLLNRSVQTLAAFSGLAMESVTRGDGWRFLDIGRKLERSLHVARLLQNTLVFVNRSESPLLEALLEIADSSMTYRRRYQGSLQVAAVLDLLLADETNPRSLGFQLAELADDIDRLPRDPRFSGRSVEQRLMLASLTTLRLADADQLVHDDGSGRRTGLEQLLNELTRALPALSDALTQTHLSHLPTSRQLASPMA